MWAGGRAFDGVALRPPCKIEELVRSGERLLSVGCGCELVVAVAAATGSLWYQYLPLGGGSVG